MRFGAFIPQGWRHDLMGIDREQHWATMRGVAGAIQSAGYESAWVYDHFHPVPEPTQEPVYEAWTLMAAIAAVTDTVRLGQMCTCNSYRQPSYLAKVAASIDVISGGRLDMGIGAGWYEHEYDGYGYEFPKPSVRIGQLAESVEIMRRMWTTDEVDFEGEYYLLRGARCQPKPLQDPHIPLWIAGGGEKRTLRVVARHGDYANFGYNLEEFKHKSEILAEHCRELGRDFDEITRTTNLNIIIGEDRAEVDERVAWYRNHFIGVVGEERAERMIQRNHVDGGGMIGTPDQLIERITAFKEAGARYVIAYFQEAAYDLRGLQLFAREVLPALA